MKIKEVTFFLNVLDKETFLGLFHNQLDELFM